MTSELKPLPKWEHLREIEWEILTAAPPIDPPSCHWLKSDAGPSFCFEHAWQRRWLEFPMMGECPSPPSSWWGKNELEERMIEGIGESFDNHSDTVEWCDECGCILSHLLTKHGQRNELENALEFPFKKIDGEASYLLTRMFMNLDWEGAEPDLLEMALTVAHQAKAVIQKAERECREAESRMIRARQAYYAATAGMSSIERVFGKKWAPND